MSIDKGLKTWGDLRKARKMSGEMDLQKVRLYSDIYAKYALNCWKTLRVLLATT